MEERRGRGNKLLAWRDHLGPVCPGRCARQGIEVGAADDVGGLLGGRLLELAPARRRANGLVHEQIHQGQARLDLRRSAGSPVSGPLRPIDRRQPAVSGGPSNSAASVSSSLLDLAHRKPNFLAEPL